ncbi:MAG: Hsp20/alpha crystallin family protein [Nitrospirota bacterium]
MFPLTKWNPSKELLSLHRDMDDLFNRMFGRTERGFSMPSLIGGFNFPAIDVIKEGNDLVAHMELPGVDPKDVEITVTGNLLTIKGERKLDKEYKREDYFSREISYGSFERSVTLPVDVNTDKIKAEYRKGLLEIRMPAVETIKGKKIEIETKEEPRKIKAA